MGDRFCRIYGRRFGETDETEAILGVDEFSGGGDGGAAGRL